MEVEALPEGAGVPLKRALYPSEVVGTDMDLETGGMVEHVENLDILDPNEPILYPGPIFEVDDEDYLHQPALGCTKENLKRGIRGFDEDERRICPLVDRKSAILYDIVQQLEEEELARSLKLLKNYNKPIVFPRELLEEEEGSYIAIKIVDPQEWKKREEERIIDAELEEQRKVLGDLSYVNDTFRVPFDHGWTREVVVRVHPAPPGAELGEYPLTSIGEVFYRDPGGNKIRSMKQIAISLEKDPVPGLSVRNFTFGKAPIGLRDQKREIIRKIMSGRHSTSLPPTKGPASAKGKKMSGLDLPRTNGNSGESPQAAAAGVKMKSSSSRRSIQPPKRYSTGQAYMYPEKRVKTGTKKDVEYPSDNEMEMGMLPPKYPRGKEDFGGGVGGGGGSGVGGGTDEAIVRRRGRPPTKRIQVKETPAAADFNGDDNSALFQISAFHSQSTSALFQGIDDVSHGGDDMYGDMPGMIDSREDSRGGEGTVSMDHQHHHHHQQQHHHHHHQGSEELLPCSIRCPAMAGEIPTLQCKRCLCLYHPECLALPPNLNFTNFLCANCEGEHGGELPSSKGSHGQTSNKQTPATPAAGADGGPRKSGGWFPPKLGEGPLKVKKPPPPLLPAFPKFSSKFGGMMNSKLKLPPPQRMNIVPPSLGRPFPTGSAAGGKSGGNKLMSSPMSILRPADDSMSISPITMKRGRGRPPKSTRLIPSLSNRNLTITPISIRPRLPVPNLAPMTKGAKSLPIPLIPPKLKASNIVGGAQGGAPQKTSMMKGGRAGSLGNLSGGGASGRLQEGLMFREGKQQQQDAARALKAPPVTFINKGPGGFPPFKRYVQSVVSIGTKKFVAVPRGLGEFPSSVALLGKAKGFKKGPGTVLGQSGGGGALEAQKQKMAQDAVEGKTTSAEDVTSNCDKIDRITKGPQHRFDTDESVLKQVFKYLNVKDLLRAARVSHVWNKVATDESLWKVVRMKNQRISDVKTFAELLKKQRTEQLDLRKMISTEEMDWENLFKSLHSVASLQQIILGPRTVGAERIATLSQHCPDISIVAT